MIHSGKGLITEDDLKNIRMKRPPGAGARWAGVPHLDLIREFQSQLRERRLVVGPPIIDATSHGEDVAFSMSVSGKFFKVEGLPTICPCIGVKASNSAKRRLKVYVGGYCLGTPFVIEDITGKKYDNGLVLTHEVNRLIDAWTKTVVTHLTPTVRHLSAVRLSEVEATQILTKIVTHNPSRRDWIIPPTRVHKIMAAFARSPQKSAWTLMSKVRGVIDKSPGHRQMEQSLQLFFCLPRWGLDRVVSPTTSGV